jgi:hypothetical protein
MGSLVGWMTFLTCSSTENTNPKLRRNGVVNQGTVGVLCEFTACQDGVFVLAPTSYMPLTSHFIPSYGQSAGLDELPYLLVDRKHEPQAPHKMVS